MNEMQQVQKRLDVAEARLLAMTLAIRRLMALVPQELCDELRHRAAHNEELLLFQPVSDLQAALVLPMLESLLPGRPSSGGSTPPACADGET